MRSNVIAGIFFLGAGVLWLKGFLFTEMLQTHKSNEPHRMAMLQIRDAVAVGASHSDVLAAYWQHRTRALQLDAEKPVGWAVSMPLEFGAGDWVLLIEFQAGQVKAVRVRTSDGPRPKDAPKDKQRAERLPMQVQADWPVLPAIYRYSIESAAQVTPTRSPAIG